MEAISGAGIVALGCTILYLLVAKSWRIISRVVEGASSFTDSIMHEAAQRLRDELERLSASQSIYLGGLLVFSLLFIAAYSLEARRLFAGYPDWQLYFLLAFLSLAGTFVLYVLLVTVIRRRRVRFRADANIAVGHRLQQISSESTRVFHDVMTSDGVIDHLVIARAGIYAVNVVSKRAPDSGTVRLHENALVFSGTASRRPVEDIAIMIKALEEDFGKLLGYKVRIRSVVAVPGWAATGQASEDHLLVNERNVTMLAGWKHHAYQLMQDDVERLQAEMTARCLHARATSRVTFGSGAVPPP